MQTVYVLEGRKFGAALPVATPQDSGQHPAHHPEGVGYHRHELPKL